MVRKKRAKAYVLHVQKDWLKKGRLPRLRKLRVVRKTRFNSNCRTLDSFLVNASCMRQIVDAADFQNAMKARSVEKNAKVEAHLKAWTSNATFERARRALAILGPAAVLCRQVATRDFFKCLPSWRKAQCKILESLATEDFADARLRETGLWGLVGFVSSAASNSQLFFFLDTCPRSILAPLDVKPSLSLATVTKVWLSRCKEIAACCVPATC